MRGSGEIARPRVARHRNAGEAERKPWAKIAEDIFGARPAGRAVGDEPDSVAAGDLFLREVHDVAEKPADRRAKDVQDFERWHLLLLPGAVLDDEAPSGLGGLVVNKT